MIVFVGPSLAGRDLSDFPGITIRPPVRQGDVYRAVADNPTAIGIIDGYFEGVPSVWHKEVLWAISQGIAVFGAASMGALRAAELDAFGMIGVGAIFEAYRDGELEDDDEVALVHAPKEMGYAPLSVAMVNVRATVASGERAGILSPAQRDLILKAAKAQFYKRRTWESILTALGALAPDTREQLLDWLVAHEVDQKRLDALALLESMCDGKTAPPVPIFDFETTHLWHRASARWRCRSRSETRSGETGYRLLGDNSL